MVLHSSKVLKVTALDIGDRKISQILLLKDMSVTVVEMNL